MVFRGQLEEEEIDQIAHDQVKDISSAWLAKAQHCSSAPQGYHEYIPISWQLTERTKHVGTLMCVRCFHEINISEAFKHRTKLSVVSHP